MTSNDDPTAQSGAAFAEHLRERSTQPTVEFTQVLATHGDVRRSESLLSFVEQGPHSRPAAWWSAASTCHVSLDLPVDMKAGDLWFDPLEAGWSLAVPLITDPGFPTEAYEGLPPFSDWFSLETARCWQVYGAHQIAPDVPASLGVVTAESASRYCTLFGKWLSNWVTWQMVGAAFDLDVLLRLWGDSPGEIGLGGTEEDSAHMIFRKDILRVQTESAFPEDTGDRNQVSLAFRSSVLVQTGLDGDEYALERVWHG